MKTRLLAMILMFMNCSIVFSQGFLEVGNEWIYEYNTFVIPGFYNQDLESIKVVKDTLISSKEYKKLEISRKAICGIFEQIEFLREENGKVFRLNQDLEGEKLMVDLEAKEPYEMIYDAAWGNASIATTVIKDSTGIEILPSGEELEIIYLRILNNSSFSDEAVYKLSKRIGFIGYSGMLFPNIGTGLCDSDRWVELRCHINNQDTIHFKQDVDCSEIFIVNSLSQIQHNEIKIYPNPANNEIFIEQGFSIIGIFNTKGQREQFEKIGHSVNIENLQQGMYILQIENNSTKEKFVRKIIKN